MSYTLFVYRFIVIYKLKFIIFIVIYGLKQQFTGSYLCNAHDERNA